MTNKLKYFIGNWKMFGDLSSFKTIYKVNQFILRSKNLTRSSKVVMCVPDTLILPFRKKLKSQLLSFGAQNCYHKDGFGPYTGSVSAKMLKKAGAKYIILGHSERRADGETNKIIKKKIVSALNQKLFVIFCIGESLKDKNAKKTFFIIKNQIMQSLDKKMNFNNIIFAYEPVWSIGTNKIPNIDTLRTTIDFIKKTCIKNFKIKKSPNVLYGGSVNGKNIHLLGSIIELDGFLIGGSSQSSKKFIDIINNYYK
jgi:triosephosphate isomerase (TIM)